MATHEDVARRWVNRIMHPGKSALGSRNLHDEGDRIFSYGHHFEVGRILRNAAGEPFAWLLNGDRWPGVVTTRHQNAVRAAVATTRLPVVTIPHEVLAAAGVLYDSVQIIDVQPDWWTSTVVTKASDSTWHWEYDQAEYEYGGWRNTRTHEFIERGSYWGPGGKPPVIECEHDITVPGPWAPGIWDGYCWEHKHAVEKAREVHLRARHGEWEEVRGRNRQTGRKRAVSGQSTDWELVNDPEDPAGFHLERTVQRHWLGGSLIRARVPYQVRVKHAECGGTGVGKPWRTLVRGNGPVLGPLTRADMEVVEAQIEYRRERYGTEDLLAWPYSIDAYEERTDCRGCSGTGRVRADRGRWAYFLSGFDENETRPSYFFCELPPKVAPATVEDALETLKPGAVRLAEQAGREVKRQGDIFAVPMPGVTLRDLKAQGGVHIRKPKLIEQDGRLVWSGERPNLLGTNHEATEIVRVGGQTYARGTLRHVPDGRRPDHKAVTIGRDWSLIVKNTVPTAA